MKKYFRPFVLSLLLLTASSAHADGYVRLNFLYLSEESGQGTKTKNTRTLLDAGGGYMWPSGLSLGGLYGTEKIKSGDTTSDRTSFGPTLGWIAKADGPFILATYFIQSELETMKGTGYEADIGYKFKLSSILLALQLSYKKFSYTKSGDATLSPAFEQTYIDPYFGIWFEF